MIVQIRFLLAIFLLASKMAYSVCSRRDVEQAQLAKIFAKISTLIRQKANLTAAERVSPKHVADSKLLLKNDMRLTASQAQRILDQLQSSNIEEPSIIDAGIGFEEGKWTLPINYAFDANIFYHTEKNIIRNGLQMWEAETCVRFEEHASKSAISAMNSILFIRDRGCYSSVGRVEGTIQNISLGAGCLYVGIVAHEIGHALGLFHEQERPDRDHFVRILWKNIDPDMVSNFAMTDSSLIYNSPYDFASIMHYDSMTFSNNYDCGKRTMETIDPHFMSTIGQDQGLSFFDAKRINIHYNCIETSCRGIRLNETCQNGGYQDPNNCTQCKCPPGFGGNYCETNGKSDDCGGILYVDACSTTTITSPNHPLPYPQKTHCSWTIKAPRGSGLIFGFESKPSMPFYGPACSCVDYVEIRTSREIESPGARFCGCGLSAGRVAAVNRNRAVVVFQSYEMENDEIYAGFRLSVYATCRGTTATGLTKECIITSTGYDYTGRRGPQDFQTNESEPCVSWKGQKVFDDLNFPDGNIESSGSFCRNPDSSDSPWCFVNTDYKHKSTAECKSISRCPTSETANLTHFHLLKDRKNIGNSRTPEKAFLFGLLTMFYLIPF